MLRWVFFPATTSIPSSTIAPYCTETGWTDYMNTDNTADDGDDVEDCTSLRLEFRFCGEEDMVGVECVSVAEEKTLTDLGLVGTCSESEGFSCIQDQQTGDKNCEDFKIRFNCDCAERVECGWTDWMNENEPDSDGESEAINAAREGYSFCELNYITGLECRQVNGTEDDLQSYYDSGEANCSISYQGFICVGDSCPDAEIRVYCEEPQCSVTTTQEICDEPLGVAAEMPNWFFYSSTCESEETGPEMARLNGDGAWRPNSTDPNPYIEVGGLPYIYSFID